MNTVVFHLGDEVEVAILVVSALSRLRFLFNGRLAAEVVTLYLVSAVLPLSLSRGAVCLALGESLESLLAAEGRQPGMHFLQCFCAFVNRSSSRPLGEVAEDLKPS